MMMYSTRSLHRYLQSLRSTLRELRLAGAQLTDGGLARATGILSKLELLDVYVSFFSTFPELVHLAWVM